MECDLSSKFIFVKNRLININDRVGILNKAGFFDEAKILELLAKNICEVVFNQKFIYLNTNKEYPYVDLKAEDSSFFIQVSTEKNISKKVKQTFSKLNKSADKLVSEIKKVKFFFFASSSKIKDKIYGRFSFEPDEDLISIDWILRKCRSNEQLIERLYQILKYQEDEFSKISKNFSKTLEKSTGFLNEVDVTLDGKLNVKREIIVSGIKDLKSSVIALVGDRGIGKKVLIKMIYSNNIILKPGIELANCTCVEDIIGIEISKLQEIMKSDGYTICITDIDSIELSISIKVLLDKLISDVIGLSNKVRLIFTFSKDDFDWYNFFSSKKVVEKYFVPRLSLNEISEIIKSIPNLSVFSPNLKFMEIMGIPLFLSFLSKYDIASDSYSDINKFKDDFWKIIITKSDSKRIQILKYIAQKTCENELPDVNCDDFDSIILKGLVSDGIVVEKKGRYSFKYSFFEELVWWNIFFTSFRDNLLSESFVLFDKLGKRVEKYYMTWISERSFFDDDICHSMWLKLQDPNSIPKKWKNLTLRGIVKSDYSREFFEKHISRIVYLSLFSDFVDAVNLFAFHPVVVNQQPMVIAARPCGSARPFFICYLSEHSELIEEKSFLKLCEDYSDYDEYDQSIANIVCAELIKSIYEFILNDELPSYRENYSIQANKINRICRIYESQSDIIRNFLAEIIEISCSDYPRNVKAKTLANYILSFNSSRFSEDYPEETCNLADSIWKEDKINQEDCRYYRYRLNYKKYGLTDWSHYSGISPMHPLYCEYRFFISLLQTDFDRGLAWIISFINEAVDCYYDNNDERKIFLSLCDGIDKPFYGDENLWIGYTSQSMLPNCIKDMLFSLRKFLFWKISSNLSDQQYIQSFFVKVKRYILGNSNNIAPLALLVSIGILFKDVIDPKEILEFALCPELIRYDFRRGISEADSEDYIPPVEYDLILKSRYGFKNFEYEYTTKTIISFFQHEKIYGSDSVKNFCNSILNNLYSKNLNDEANMDIQYFIHCMDVIISDGIISSKEITGSGAAYQKFLICQCSAVSSVINEIKQAINGIENNTITKDKCIDIIKKISSEPDHSSWHVYGDSYFIQIVTYALSKFELDLTERNWLCMEYVKFFWIYSHTMSKEGLLIFYNQLKKEISDQTANAILKIILYIMLGSYTNVHTFIPDTVLFLRKHNDISIRIFNTLIVLSSSMKTHIGKKEILNSIDLMKGAEKKGSMVLDKYLYKGEAIVIPDSLENCDFAYLIRIFYSGIQINKENKSFFRNVWKRIVNWANKISTDFVSIELSFGFVCDYFNT